LDSGAAMAMFPAKFVDQMNYMGKWMIVRGVVGVPVEVEGEKADTCDC